ncbi:MAG: hypothetical protein ACI9WU_002950 [Myxococcota bacterium]|jgi:hypothetical protein
MQEAPHVKTQALLIAAIFLIPSLAHAGDPCPIRFAFYDLGVPEWLDRDTVLDGLESKDSYIGISFNDTKGGVRVSRVYEGSPAAISGLKKGDVITTAGGKALSKHQELGQYLDATSPGGSLKLKIIREGVASDLTLTLGKQDPLIGALINYAVSQDCTHVRRTDIDAEQRKALLSAVFSKARRFQCDSAHRKLGKLEEQGLDGGDLVVVRGSKRVLISSPAWKTVCVKAKDFDGKNLTKKAVGRLFHKLTRGFVSDRHSNP